MRTHGLCMLLVSATCSIQAQTTFENVYLSTTSFNVNLIELNSHNLLTGLAWYPGVSLLDPDGNFISSKCFYGDQILTMGSVRERSDNAFYFTSNFRTTDSCTLDGFTFPDTHPIVGKMDSLGNIQALYHYELSAPSCPNFSNDLIVTSDEGAIIWDKEVYFFAFRVDSTLTPIWAKRFPNHGGFQFIKELPGGDLLAGINMDTAGAVVARLDANGNFI